MTKHKNERPEEVKEAIVAYIKSHYHYDGCKKCVRRKNGSILTGCAQPEGYIKAGFYINGKLKLVRMHQIVWVLHWNRLPSQIDHINGNRLDNRYENLREVTGSENSMNRIYDWKPNKRTGLPGVYRRRDGKYKADIFAKSIYGPDKYCLFHTLTLLGRNYQAT